MLQLARYQAVLFLLETTLCAGFQYPGEDATDFNWDQSLWVDADTLRSYQTSEFVSDHKMMGACEIHDFKSSNEVKNLNMRLDR